MLIPCRFPSCHDPVTKSKNINFWTLVVVAWLKWCHNFSTPLRNIGGRKVMNLNVQKTWQPNREVWSKGKLVLERAIALGNVMDKSTLSNYGSALNSYLNFVTQHDFPVEPTTEILSFFTVYMCHHINPRSVNTYLTGISQQLETYFPDVKNARNSPLLCRTLQGCIMHENERTSNCAQMSFNGRWPPPHCKPLPQF